MTAEPSPTSKPDLSSWKEDLIRSFFIVAVAVVGFIILKSRIDFLYKNYDFHLYYATGLAYNAGLDPYVQSNLHRMHPPDYLPFIYPPYTLPLFGLLARLQFDWAIGIYFTLQFFALWTVVLVWRRYFIGPRRDALLTLLLCCGLIFAGWYTWVTGNISNFEQAFLWLAFACFVRGRYHLFGILLLLGGLPRLVPLLFMVLLLVARHERKNLLFLGYSGVAIAWLGAWQLISPVYMEKWLTMALVANNGEGGASNPSWRMMVFDAARLLHIPWVTEPIYLMWTIGVLVLSIRAVRARLAVEPEIAKAIVAFAVITFCLFAPRLKPYTLIMVIPSLILFSYDVRGFRLPVWTLAILPMLGTIQAKIPLVTQICEIVSFYWPQVVFIVTWFLGLRVFQRAAAEGAGRQRAEEPV